MEDGFKDKRKKGRKNEGEKRKTVNRREEEILIRQH